jgi:pectinesterase
MVIFRRRGFMIPHTTPRLPIALIAAIWLLNGSVLIGAAPAGDVAPGGVDGSANSVAADGSGQFKTVQEAIAAIPDNDPKRVIVHIKPGTYQGQILLPASKTNVTFEGDAADRTILTYALNQNEPVPAGQSPRYRGAAVALLASDFRAENITFQNTSGDHGQAMALRLDGDRAVIRHCRMLGWQDTLLCWTGRHYFKDCYIEGRVDFIYGGATAVFRDCEIHSKNGGHITAASTPQDHPFGFVFYDCKLTGDAVPWASTQPATQPAKVAPKADLGRPWRPFASVTFINCEMGDHIKPEGWSNWRNRQNEKTARYAEYNSTGPGADPDQRAPWSKQLSKDEAARITVDSVLGGLDGWKPDP